MTARIEHTVSDFKIKASNPDNEPQIAQLVSLFEESYGERFPFRGVYDREFWQRNAGSRLVSILAVQRHKVLAHIAARHESRDPALVQLCFPACRAEFSDRAVEAARCAWETLSSVASRQKWRAIYWGAFSDLELMQRIGVEAFDMTTTAILPGYSPALNPRCAGPRGQDRAARSHVAVTVKTLIEPQEQQPLFVPAQHRSMVEFLRASVGTTIAHLETPLLGQVSADAEGIEEKYFKEWHAWHVFVRPSLVRDLPTRLLTQQPSAGRAFVFVDARDSACPQAAEQLEAHGYLFCGLLPQLAGTECLVYAKPDENPVEATSFVCPVARTLADYISEQDSARLSRVSSKRPSKEQNYVVARS